MDCILLYFTSCSIDTTNRVTKFSISIHLILCEKEQNKILLYFKFKKNLKTGTYLFRNNPITQYNSASIILFLYNSSITFIIILLIAIRLSNKHTFIKVNAVIVEVYTILVYTHFFDRYVQYNTWWNKIPVGYNKYTHSLLEFGINGVISVSEFSKFDQQFSHNKCINLFLYKLC